MLRNHSELLLQIQTIHNAIRDAVVAACEQSAIEQLSTIVGEEGGDTIFAIDRVSEEVLLQHFEQLAQEWSCLLIAEGLGASGRVVLPVGTDPDQAEIVVIVDPIDGTRGLMYQKRSAWILTGVAANSNPSPTLAEIELAVQTEIPLIKQHLSDQLWAVHGAGATGTRYNRLNGTSYPLVPHPSQARTIAQGYGQISRFFPGTRGELALVDDLVVARVLGPVEPGRAQTFEDQYICTGGQFYELMLGHDRWIADLRPLVEPLLLRQGQALGISCHPYDVCTALIAQEAGVIITDGHGQALDALLDVDTPVAWIGYANSFIQAQLQPALLDILAERGLGTVSNHDNGMVSDKGGGGDRGGSADVAR